MPLLALATALLAAVGFAPQNAAKLPPPPWPVELRQAFELYYAGEFLETQQVCQQLRAATRDSHLRREASALAALATMRLPGRENRIGGRAQLAQLAKDDVSLLTRPECQLAYGIAQTALSETATALHHLNEAAKTFAARGQTDRLGEACVALAEAWAHHAEWELDIPGMDVSQPQNPAAADRIRSEQIRALRQRVEALPDGGAYVTRIDLILARHLVETEDGVAEGLMLLEELTQRRELTAETAQACLTLAARYETARRWTDAARLYTRVQAGGLGELSRRAEQRRKAIEQPQLVLELPSQVLPGEAVSVRLQARNVAEVDFEVRRVDLERWLEQRQGRFAEATLPASGALVAVRQLSTAVINKHDWWYSDGLDESLRFQAPAGACVVLARAADSEGRPVTAKRLMLGGDLAATVFTGSRHAVLWATGGGRSGAAPAEIGLQARFWMHGSFVPMRLELADGVAVFALPPEARLLRDKRWVCLVRTGEEMTLCHGTLPPGAGRQRVRPSVALIAGPPEPHVGEELRVFGLLLGGAGDPRAAQRPQTVELELLDTLDSVCGTATADVSDAGAFSAGFPISAALAGKHLHVSARLDGQVLESVCSPPKVHVMRSDETPLLLRCALPRWLRPPIARVAGRLEAAYPWGTVASNAFASIRFRAVRLRTAEPKREQVHSEAIGGKLWLDAAGKREFTQTLSDFNLPDGPLAVGMWANVAGWDGRQRPCSTQLLIGPDPISLWLRCETDTPRVGEPLYVSTGWFDPTGRAAGARPTVAVWRHGAPLTHLPLLPVVNGLRSGIWRPPASGAYELVATLIPSDGEPLTARETIHVQGRHAADAQDLTPIRCEARFTQHEGRPHVRVRLDAQRQDPVLVLLEDGDPLAARQLPSLDGPTELLVPLPEYPHRTTHLVLAAPDREGIRILEGTEVGPGDEGALTLTLSCDSEEIRAGETVRLSATCLRAGEPVRELMLLARLADASESGRVQWLPGESRPDLALLPSGLQVVSSSTSDRTTDASGGRGATIPETRELSDTLVRALFEDPTLWLDCRPSAKSTTTFSVPLPRQPGLYRLMLAALAPDGALTSKTLDLDTRRDVLLSVDVAAHLVAGDRSIASLTISNDQPTATSARVTFDGGPGLHVDKLRLFDRPGQRATPGDGAPVAFTLPPFSAVTVCATIEATQPGAGTAAFVVETEGPRRQCVAASYSVHPGLSGTSAARPEAATRGTIDVRRSLFLLEEPPAVEGEMQQGPGEPAGAGDDWIRVEVPQDARIPPGQLLLVREELSLEQPLRQVEWKQRLPANCCTYKTAWRKLPRIGRQHALQLDTLTYSTAGLDAGQAYTHEYVIVPIRPGVCQFPPPEVRADGLEVPVRIGPELPRVLVTDPK